jgi:hypothetical protein
MTKTFLVKFCDGREVPVDLPDVSVSRAREICERRFRLVEVAAVSEDRSAIEAAWSQAMQNIREALHQ